MSLRLSSTQSSHIVSLWGGLGIPGSEVPTTGDNGGSPLANDGISPTSEYRIETVTAPSAGTLTVYPDTSYEFSGAPDGTYPWVYSVWEDSIDRGTATEYLVVGSPVVTVTATTGLPSFSGGVSVAGSTVDVAFDTVTALPVFSGSVHVATIIHADAVTSLPVFSGGMLVSPLVDISTTTLLPVFSGSIVFPGMYANAPSGYGPSIIAPNTTRPPNIGGTRY